MDFYIKPRGKLFIIEDDSGVEHSGLLSSYESAQARRDELETAARSQLKDIPGAQERRQQKAAYREVDRDPVLKMLKNFLPRKGQIERDTRAGYDEFMQEIGKRMTITSSNPDVHAELNKSEGQRRVSNAANAKREGAEPTREEVKRRWEALALAGMPEHKRASQIEEDMGIKNVRRFVRSLKLGTKKVRP